MSDEKGLRGRVREALRAGRLPNARPERIWGGPGTGERCAVCDEPIEPHQAELELQFANHGNGEPVRGKGVPLGEPDEPSGDKSGGASYQVHVRCHAAWEFERKNGHALPGAGEQGIMNLDERDTANGMRGG